VGRSPLDLLNPTPFRERSMAMSADSIFIGKLGEYIHGYRLGGAFHFSPATYCGNGRLEGGESCDDGNSESADGCSAACRVEHFWELSGTAAGGAMAVTLHDHEVSIATEAGQSAADVSQALTEAINGADFASAASVEASPDATGFGVWIVGELNVVEDADSGLGSRLGGLRYYKREDDRRSVTYYSEDFTPDWPDFSGLVYADLATYVPSARFAPYLRDQVHWLGRYQIHVSAFEPTGFWGKATVIGHYAYWMSNGDRGNTSTFDSDFSILVPTNYTLTAQLRAGELSRAELRLGGANAEPEISEVVANQDGPDGEFVGYDWNGVLEPGQYSLVAKASSGGLEEDEFTGSAAWEFDLSFSPVPEPTQAWTSLVPLILFIAIRRTRQ
jgi:cysteine-rich repeat protein